MIAGWLLYCLAVSALLAAAATVVDAALTRRGRPARWVWVAAMVGSLAIPAASYLQQQLASDPTMPSGANEPSLDPFSRFPNAEIDAPPDRWKPLRTIATYRPRAPEPLGTERAAMLLAVVCIVIAGLRVAIDSVLLYRGRRGWTPEVVDGVSVLVSEELGPAIVGLIEPKIVVPRWTFALPQADRDLMLTHEQEHLRAHDGRLTTAALLVVISMPWNPAMWYLLRRLRTAIEIDCDRRVLRAFPDVRRYGQLLVGVAERAMGSSLAIAGFSERASPVAKRINAMTATAKRRMSARDVASGMVGVLAVTGAFVLLPPDALKTASWLNNDSVVAKYVADSIAEAQPEVAQRSDSGPSRNRSHIIVAAARDLPVSFAVSEKEGDPPSSTESSCPYRLRDDRDGTSLLRSVTVTNTFLHAQHGDTSWLRQRRVGYYMVDPDGRYGVSRAKDQTLRVGCGGVTQVIVAGRPVELPNIVATLDTQNDDRPRRIGAEVVALIHAKPLAVDLYSGRLEIVIGDTAAIARDPDAPHEFTRAIFGRARDIIGRVAMPETLAVSVRRGRDTWVTNYYYNSMAK